MLRLKLTEYCINKSWRTIFVSPEKACAATSHQVIWVHHHFSSVTIFCDFLFTSREKITFTRRVLLFKQRISLQIRLPKLKPIKKAGKTENGIFCLSELSLIEKRQK